MEKITVGVDIGGTNTVFGLVDKKGCLIAKDTIPTQKFANAESYTKILCQKIKELFAKYSHRYELIGIGIGAPNGNYWKGTIEFAPNLPWGNMVNLVDLVQKQINIPVKLTNDANAGALGEQLFGGAKKMKNFIFITLGTGLGSGIVANGKLIYGHDGFAGEMGHVIVHENGRLCGCGRKGCLETYTSATGIKRTVEELLLHNNETKLSGISIPEISAKDIYDAAKIKNKIALKAFEITAEILGKALANATALFSPEAIFLFGGLANAHDLLLKPVKEQMENYQMPIFKNKVKIMKSELLAGEAAIVGASALIYKELAQK